MGGGQHANFGCSPSTPLPSDEHSQRSKGTSLSTQTRARDWLHDKTLHLCLSKRSLSPFRESPASSRKATPNDLRGGVIQLPNLCHHASQRIQGVGFL